MSKYQAQNQDQEWCLIISLICRTILISFYKTPRSSSFSISHPPLKQASPRAASAQGIIASIVHDQLHTIAVLFLNWMPYREFDIEENILSLYAPIRLKFFNLFFSSKSNYFCFVVVLQKYNHFLPYKFEDDFIECYL